MLHIYNFGKKTQRRAKVQHTINEKKGYTFRVLDTKNIEEGGGGCNTKKMKKTLCVWSYGHKKHMIHHQCPTLAQARNI